MGLKQTAVIRRSAKELDVILYLQGKFPHSVEHIFGELVNEEALFKIRNIPRWSAALLPIWKLRWERNVAQFPLWRVLSSRAEYYESLSTKKLNHRDAHCYRDLYHNIQDCIQKIENNKKKGFDQQPKQKIIDFEGTIDKYKHISRIHIDHKHIFVGLSGISPFDDIRVFKRWSLTPVSCESFETVASIQDIQVNNRVVVIESYFFVLKTDYVLKVLDAETLDTIQIICETPNTLIAESSYYLSQEDIEEGITASMVDCCFYLSGDLLYHIVVFEKQPVWADYFAIINTHQWNKSSGHFETIRKRKFEFSSWNENVEKLKVYVDDRYCIFEWVQYGNDLQRHFEVRCINTMELKNARKFQDDSYIKTEYNDGIIVVPKLKSSAIAWDVHNNKVRPIASHPYHLDNLFDSITISNLFDSFTISNLSYSDEVQAFGVVPSYNGYKLVIADLI